jgi:ABC-type amino acid transport substrate-binding protein/nitrogen-specific signal transduction histidine kinase
MKQVIFLISALTIILSGSVLTKEALGAAVKLSQEEREWIQNHHNIRLSPDPDFLPLEHIDNSGNYVGIAADYVRLLEKKLNINFEILKLKNWDEVIEKAKTRETDMWGAATPTPQRLEYMLFTKPFIELPAVIIVRNKTQETLSSKELKGLKIAVISGYGIHDYLSLNHPEIELDVVADISTGLKKVSFGMVDAMIANIALATHYIEKDGISNLRVAGESGYIYKWGLASRNDWPELNKILQKGIDLISEREKIEIYRKWVGLKTAPSLTFKDFVLPVLSLLGLFAVIAIIISNRVLKKQVLKRTEDLRKELFERKERERELLISKKIWDVMKDTKSLLISSNNSKIIFEKTLDDLLSITEGEYGFIAEVLIKEDGQPYLKTKAMTNIAWNEETQKLYENQYEQGLEFHNLDTLFGKVITSRETVIANDPKNDDRAGGLPEGHPQMNCFLGVPLIVGENLIGMFGLANKPGGYHDSDLVKLAPYLDTCSTIFMAFKENEQRVKFEQKLKTANQALELSNKELSSFASITSHDLKTPIRKIANFCFYIDDDESQLSDQAKQYLSKIDLAATHAAELIDGILNYSQLGEDKTPYKKIDLNDTILKVMEYLEVEIQESKAKIEFSNLPLILGNELQIEQLVENLISNSLKYRREGVAPIIKITHSEKSDNNIQLFVNDNGLGFKNIYAEKIFDPFQRLDGDISKIGSGLGLSICKKIMLAHGGDLSANGKVGQGAEFIITFKKKNRK